MVINETQGLMKKVKKENMVRRSMRKLILSDKKELLMEGFNIPEKIITRVVDTALEVEVDCRLKAEELFSLFTADIIKKEIVFYR